MRIIVLILTLFLSATTYAQEKIDAPTVNAQESQVHNNEDIQKIEKYLNNITTLIASFVQEDSEGVNATGTFYLERPGKLRWDYDPPTPILIVAKGSLVAYYDKELEQVSHVSLDDTLAGFLTRKRISFNDEGEEVIGYKKQDGVIYITITQKEQEEEGTLTMAFNERNLDIMSMEVIDAIGKKTFVQFSTIVYGKEIEKNMFNMPKLKNRRR